MLLFVVIAFLLLIFTWFIHYHQHFQCQCVKRPTKSLPPTPSKGESNDIQIQIQLLKKRNAERCCFVLSPIDDEEFDFFPMSFLLYLTLLILLYIIIIAVDLLNYYSLQNNESIINLFIGYSLQSYHNNTLFELHSFTVIHIMDYILIYALLLLSLWVSLFSFYRYYTTLMSLKRLKSVSTTKLFKKFAIYALVFCVVFILEIHLYYWLWPLIITSFIAFNVYCTYHSSAALIHQYKLFLNRTSDLNGVVLNMNHDILRSVKRNNCISLICCILHSIHLAAFIIGYNVNIMYYISISLSVSSFIFSLNFVRNFKVFKHILIRFKEYCSCSRPKTVKTNRNSSNNKPLNKDPSKSAAQSVRETVKAESIDIVIATSLSCPQIGTDDPYHSLDDTKTDTDHLCFKPPHLKRFTQSRSLGIYDTECDTMHKLPSHSPLQRALTVPMMLYEVQYDEIEENKDILPSKIKVNVTEDVTKGARQKALEVLGLTPTVPKNISTFPNVSRLRELSIISRLSSRPQHDDDTDSSPEPNITPVPLHLNVTPMVEEFDEAKDITFEIPSSIMELDSTPEPTTNDDGMMGEIEEKEDGMLSMIEASVLKHARSRSAPQMMEEMFLSFDVFANYGFCDRENINSVKELSRYRESVNGISDGDQRPFKMFNRSKTVN